MPWLRHFALFLVFVTALFRPAAAGAFVSAPDAGPQARVGAFDLVAATLAGPASAATCGLHEGIGAAYDENASGYRFAAGGGPALARQLGTAGETAAGIVKNTERITSLTGTARYRIPDILDHSVRVIGEVKNVGRLSYTNQLRDFAAYAQQYGYTFELWVRPTTQLSGPLQQAVGQGQIVLRFLP
jgi:hypothetical protein